ncbi:MAG: hypothetical protein JWP87_5539 [Labilithrix sp.]|nr:hypothetical protein [Labilithrix sp.]
MSLERETEKSEKNAKAERPSRFRVSLRLLDLPRAA